MKNSSAIKSFCKDAAYELFNRNLVTMSATSLFVSNLFSIALLLFEINFSIEAFSRRRLLINMRETTMDEFHE